METFEEGTHISRYVDAPGGKYNKKLAGEEGGRGRRRGAWAGRLRPRGLGQLRPHALPSPLALFPSPRCGDDADLGMNCYLKMLLRDNFVHADLHPGERWRAWSAQAGRLQARGPWPAPPAPPRPRRRR